MRRYLFEDMNEVKILPAKTKKKENKNLLLSLLVLLITIIFLIFIWQQKANLHRLSKMGYLGIFLVNVISSATVIVPLPGVASVIIGGAIWNPILVGLYSGLGAAMGEVISYLLGYSSRGLLKTHKKKMGWIGKVEEFFKRQGFLTTFIFSLLPLPVFDVIGIMAGILGYPIWKFALATLLGRVIRNFLIAWSGAKFLPL